MSNKNTIFYKQNQAYLLDFSAVEISSNASIVLLDKIERKNSLIKSISNLIPNTRENSKVEHSYYKILKQRVYLMMSGY